MEKVLVIGSNSFSGSHMVKALLDHGYSVTGISRSPEIKELYRAYRHDLHFSFQQLDLNKDLNRILELIHDQEFPYIVNFASQSMVGESWENPDHWYQTNAVATVKLIKGIAGMDALKNYVHISTPEVYGSCEGLVKEDAPFNPSTPYAGSRAAADDYIRMMVKNFQFPATFTRAANVYGSGQQLFKIIPRAMVYLKKGLQIPLHGGGHAQRSFIHINDVCEGTVNVMERGKPGEIYHLSTDDLISIRDLVAKICDKAGMNLENSVDASQTRIGLDKAYILDSSKAKKELDWSCKKSLDEGLDEVWNWIGNNWQEINTEPLNYIHKP